MSLTASTHSLRLLTLALVFATFACASEEEEGDYEPSVDEPGDESTDEPASDPYQDCPVGHWDIRIEVVEPGCLLNRGETYGHDWKVTWTAAGHHMSDSRYVVVPSMSPGVPETCAIEVTDDGNGNVLEGDLMGLEATAPRGGGAISGTEWMAHDGIDGPCMVTFAVTGLFTPGAPAE